MEQVVPSQCPECHAIAVQLSQIPPDSHDRGNQWYSRAECTNCGEFVKWID